MVILCKDDEIYLLDLVNDKLTDSWLSFLRTFKNNQ